MSIDEIREAFPRFEWKQYGNSPCRPYRGLGSLSRCVIPRARLLCFVHRDQLQLAATPTSSKLQDLRHRCHQRRAGAGATEHQVQSEPAQQVV